MTLEQFQYLRLIQIERVGFVATSERESFGEKHGLRWLRGNDRTAVAINQTADIFAQKNRGLLLDILVFLTNLFLMHLLVKLFLVIFRQASAGDMIAKSASLLFYLGLLVLPSLGAVLKRWHFHQRSKTLGESAEADGWLPFGCIFLPFAYLVVNMFITLAVSLTLLELFPGTEVGGAFLIFGLPYNIFQMVLVFRYFSPPKQKPKSGFLRDPRSDVWGDVCIFLNVILYQVLLNWVILVYPGFHEGKFVDRFVPLLVFALLMYTAGRIFFLAEDISHPRTWLTILVANSVVILRALFSMGSHAITK